MAGDFTLGLSGDIGVDCDFGLDGDFCLDGDAGLDGDVGLGAGGDLTLVDVDGVLVGDAGLGGEISLVGDTLIFFTIILFFFSIFLVVYPTGFGSGSTGDGISDFDFILLTISLYNVPLSACFGC